MLNCRFQTIKTIAVILLLQCTLLPTAHALDWAGIDWTASNIQLLYGDNFKLGSSGRTTVTVEHAHGWKYGTNFFFVDVIGRNDIGVEVYAEVYSYFSMNKITGLNWSMGPIKDISFVAGLNISNKPNEDNFKAYLFGLSFDLSNPIFNYLQLDVAAFKNDNLSGKYGVQITPVWSLPFKIGFAKFEFRGFMDLRTGNTNASGNFNMLAQPQLLLDMGDLFGWKSDRIYMGTELSYWHNKFGIKGVHESVFQAMILGKF